jgi:hypothetical protein
MALGNVCQRTTEVSKRYLDEKSLFNVSARMLLNL